ncbi:MAG TPA: DHA2 family efflux MFS transporter permease subunit [Burkholderiaceae bacterium]|nr:DHA2 family efflux MFS transporter permease subunit [Burkholderiaceae bacterium]HQR72060.1 DHA2 family efflux MFS transporter permease subunit [Burkholderiaceae bacterium]
MTSPPSSLAALRARYGPRYRWYVLATVMLGTIASIMASTIVNVAVPDMSRHFTLSPSQAQWLAAGFMAAMTISMPLTPWLLERHGYRRTYVGAVVLLLAGSIAGGLANSYALVLAMRVAEGCAAGVLQPIPAVIVLRGFDARQQGRAMGLFGFGVVLAPALGPSIGGILVEWFGWRSIFFVASPFCLAAIPLAWKLLPHSAPGGAEVKTASARLDLRGLALVAVAILLGLNGLALLHGTQAESGLGMLLASGVAFALFVRHQRRSPAPLMRLDLFRHRRFRLGTIVAFVYGAGLFGSTYLLPIFMQEALALPPSQAGAVLLPAGIVLAFTIPVVGRIAMPATRGAYVVAGLALLTLSFVLMLTVGPGSALALITAFAVLGRIGLGCILPSLNLTAMQGVAPELAAQGTSMINLVRQLGGAAGVSLIGVFLAWRLDVAGSPTSIPAFHQAFLLLGALTGLALVAAWGLRRAHE